MAKKKAGCSPPRNFVHLAMIVHAKPGAHTKTKKAERQQLRIALRKGKEVFLTGRPLTKLFYRLKDTCALLFSSMFTRAAL